ncbi:hypothetical protein HYV72_02565 [Candidatus Uhrbacteria bacterium]|nr:hypothetical protein [Candidatus Uhrbacteria bacterium]
MKSPRQQLYSIQQASVPREEFTERLWERIDAVHGSSTVVMASFIRNHRRMTITAAIMTLVVIITGGTGAYAYTSAEVTPEHPLYNMKTNIERVEERLALDAKQRAEFNARMAARRAQEFERTHDVALQSRLHAQFLERLNMSEEERARVQNDAQAREALRVQLEALRQEFVVRMETELEARIDAAVAQGALTSEQAAQLRTQIEQNVVLRLNGNGEAMSLFNVREALIGYVREIAHEDGMTLAQLRAKARAGGDTYVAQLEVRVKARVDADVQSGDLTASQAADVKAALNGDIFLEVLALPDVFNAREEVRILLREVVNDSETLVADLKEELADVRDAFMARIEARLTTKVDTAVSGGDVTAEQAAELKDAINDDIALELLAPGAPDGEKFREEVRTAIKNMLVDERAIVNELREKLADVRDDFVAEMKAKLVVRIDAMVQAGDFTAREGAELKAAIDQKLILSLLPPRIQNILKDVEVSHPSLKVRQNLREIFRVLKDAEDDVKDNDRRDGENNKEDTDVDQDKDDIQGRINARERLESLLDL